MKQFDDLARHHVWATHTLLTFCRDVDNAILNAPDAGSFGSIIETWRHIVDSEMSYAFRLTGAWPERPWQSGEAMDFDTLEKRAAMTGDVLVAYLAGNVDLERDGEAYGDEGTFDVKHGIFLAQIFWHASEHRSQICSILGRHGIEPPDIQPWEYGIASGRMVLREA